MICCCSLVFADMIVTSACINYAVERKEEINMKNLVSAGIDVLCWS